MIPVGDLMRQLILALGAAMLVGSLAVVVRERFGHPGPADRPRANMKIVALNLVLGIILAAWGLSSILAA